MSWTPYLQSPWPPFHLERILGADDRGSTVAGSASGDFESASALLAMQSRENHGQRGTLPTQGMTALMTAIWQAEAMGVYSLYRLAVIMLAEMGLSMGLSASVTKTLGDCMPQVRIFYPTVPERV